MKRPQSQMGASLVTILMIVAAMSAVALGITQSLSKSVARAKTLDKQAQFRVSAVAAEAYGQYELSKLLLDNEGRLSIDMPGFYGPITQSFERGTITLRFTDKTNCFDLNRLGSWGSGNEVVPVTAEIANLTNTLIESGIDRYVAETFSEATADWIDSDQVPQLRGAEDRYYASEEVPRQSRGTWLQNATELNGIKGFTADVRAIADDVLCVRPRRRDDQPWALFNINTITPSQLPLLVAVYQGEVDISNLEDALRRRPIGGWVDEESYLTDAELTELDPDFVLNGVVSLYSQYIQADIRLQYEKVVADYEVLYQIVLNGPPQIVQRRRAG